jgi:hypothetical protein
MTANGPYPYRRRHHTRRTDRRAELDCEQGLEHRIRARRERCEPLDLDDETEAILRTLLARAPDR